MSTREKSRGLYPTARRYILLPLPPIMFHQLPLPPLRGARSVGYDMHDIDYDMPLLPYSTIPPLLLG